MEDIDDIDDSLKPQNFSLVDLHDYIENLLEKKDKGWKKEFLELTEVYNSKAGYEVYGFKTRVSIKKYRVKSR